MVNKNKKVDELTYNEILTPFIDSINKETDFLEIIANINQNELLFDSELVIQLFKLIPQEARITYLELFIKNCTVQKTLTIHEILSIIKLFASSEKKIAGFILLLNTSFFPVIQASDLIEIITFFNSQSEVISDLLVKTKKLDNLLNYQFKDIIFALPSEIQKEMLLYFRKKIPHILDDATLLWLIQLFKPLEIPQLFQELVIEDETIDEEEIFKYLGSDIDTNLAFSLINLYILEKCKKYNYQEKKQLFDKVKKYIVDYGDFFCAPYPNGKILYDEINRLTCEEYGFNILNFTKFISQFGYESFHFLDCANIKKLLSLDPESVELILNLFTDKYTTLDQHTLNNILNAFYQREFLLKRKEEYLIFGCLEKLISEQNESEIRKKFDEIAKIIDIQTELTKYNLNLDEFIKKLLLHDYRAKNIMHDITNKYIMISRENFVNSKIKLAHQDLNLIKRVEKNIAKKYFYKNNSLEDIVRLLLSINQAKLSANQIALLNNSELLNATISYKMAPQNTNLNPDFYNALSQLEKMVNILWEDGKIQIDNVANLKYTYIPEKVDSFHTLSILAELDIGNLSKTLLNDEALYKKLTNLFEKYKITGWGVTFESLAEKIDLSLDSSMIASIINYFYVIYPELAKDTNISLTKLITYGNCYSSTSNKFAYLFGDEDYKLICANEGNYKAPAPKHKRLELAVEHLIEMYQKEYITIPSYDKDYTLKNGKKINAVIGNSTCMKNLTIGERTDSCLRICGIFYELYKFVIKNENGFNICFYDQAGNFISRVSGIRNGNTVFLNELRDSLNPQFKNVDLLEVMTLVSNELIKLSTNSDFPIDNVVISPRCALADQEDNVQYIGEDVIANNLYKLPFNYDLDGFALLLAARDPGKYTKKNGDKNLPKYKCCHDKIKVFNTEDQANKRFIQFMLINGLLNGKNLDEIPIPTQRVTKCISSDKFIIVQDSSGEIITLILDKFKDDEHVKEQITSILNDLQTLNTERRRR